MEIDKTKLYYLAHPYNGDHFGNFDKANKIASDLLKIGIHTYSPVSHTHPIDHAGDLDASDHDIWIPLDKHFMKFCDGLILCKGWEDSFGCNIEHDYFMTHLKPIYLIQEILKE